MNERSPVVRVAMSLVCLVTLMGAADQRSLDDKVRDAALADVRERVKLLEAGENDRRAVVGLDKSTAAAYQSYVAAYYRQETELRDQRVSAYQWQLFASNVVLSLVACLTVAGVLYSGYQLYTAANLARKADSSGPPDKGKADSRVDSIDLEVSVQKVRIQTSVVGIVVLLISGFFLSSFLKDVYKITAVADCVVNAKPLVPG